MTQFSLSTTILAAALCLAGCAREAPDAPDNVAGEAASDVVANAPTAASLTSSDGQPRGSIMLSEDPTGLTIKVAASGLTAGVHGVHLHDKGLCEGPKFESAGGHWNPGAKQHGRDNPAGAHLGDLANLTIAADGSGSTTFLVSGATLSGAGAVGDGDGTSLVIHAKADDYKTDPSGNSGDRVACAVVAAGR